MTEASRLISLVQALYRATGSGDWPAAEALLTDDFLVSEASHLPMAGEYRGKDALQRLYEKVFADIDIVGLDVQAMTAGDNHAVCILDMLLAGVPPVRVKIAELFVFRGEQVCEIRPYYFDPKPVWAALRTPAS